MVTVPPLRSWEGAEAAITALGVDTLITAWTMSVIPARLIKLFGGRAANLHPAMLPEYRGPSPLLAMLLDGAENRSAGLSLHVLTAGIDEGAIIAQQPLPFDAAGRDYQTWLAQHAAMCRRLMREVMPAYLGGKIVPAPQAGGFYRRASNEAVIGPHTTLAQVEHLLAVAGSTRRVVAEFAGRQRPVVVKSIAKWLGPPTGEPGWLGALTLTLDLVDARVRLDRVTTIDRVGDRLRLITALRKLDQE